MNHDKKRVPRPFVLLVLACTALATALPALAAGGGNEGGGNIFTGDVGNILWTLLIFGGVLFILGKYAWGPLLDVLEKREELIKNSLAEARRDREEAAAKLKEYEDRINQARADATEIVEEGRRDAEVLKQRIEQDAREEAEKVIARGRRDLAIARETAIKDLYELSGELAAKIASRIVERELKTADHEKLIADAIGQVGRLEAN